MRMTHSPFSRRNLLTGALAGSVAAAGLPLSSARAAGVSLKPGATILFQGDSITDAGRDRKTDGNANNPAMLGR